MRGVCQTEDWGWSNAPRFGPSGGGTTTTTQQTNTQPWSVQQPYLQNQFENAANLYGNQANWPQYYPGSTYAPMNPQQNASINQIESYGAAGGTPVLNQAQGALGQGLNQAANAVPQQLAEGQANLGMQAQGSAATQPLLGQSAGWWGNMISGNGSTYNPYNAPGFQNVVNQTLANTLPATTAGFISGGRSDSGLATNAATNAAINAVGGLALNQYNTQQGLQNTAAQNAANAALTQQQNINTGLSTNAGILGTGMQALGQGAQGATALDAQTLNAMNAGLMGGTLTQQDVQNQLSDYVNRWNYNQTLPWNMASQNQGLISGNYGGTGTGSTSQPYYSNTAANVLGTGSEVASIAAAVYLI